MGKKKDEIERLKAENVRLKAEIESYKMCIFSVATVAVAEGSDDLVMILQDRGYQSALRQAGAAMVQLPCGLEDVSAD